jgi:DNA-binding FrmR family transcriptional regulator
MDDVTLRLKKVAGQVEALVRMIDGGGELRQSYCSVSGGKSGS